MKRTVLVGNISFLFLFALLTVSTVFCALFFGSTFISPEQFRTESGTLSPLILSRICRIATSFTVGGSLAIAGSVYQAVLRNPLADPFILGVSGSAALGTALAFITGAAMTSACTIPVFAGAGALAAIVFVLLLGSITARGESTALLLSGVITGTVSSSILMCLISFAGTTEMCSVTWFMLGDLSSADPVLLRFFLFFIPFPVLLLWLLSPKANALALGDDHARSLGIDPVKTSYFLIILASLLTAGSVAVSGIIGFAGLIIPHILRKCGFSDNRKLFPLSFWAGGVFLTLCDLLSRCIFPEREIPPGVITSLAGGTLFLWILYENGKERNRKR